MLCPKSCNGCKRVDYFPFLAVVRSTDLCSMCAQGTDTVFIDMERRHCREKPGCFPRWKQGCPAGCSQWVDRKRIAGTQIWAYLTEDGKWYVIDKRVCDALERWEYPVRSESATYFLTMAGGPQIFLPTPRAAADSTAGLLVWSRSSTRRTSTSVLRSSVAIQCRTSHHFARYFRVS
eukprot:SAG11_NODE_2070_length_3864_cov_1.772112_3_plen_177_part_00